VIAKDIMDTDFVSVDPEMSLREAADLMTRQYKMLLPVISEDSSRRGILMEVDLLRAVLPKYLDSVSSLNFLPPTDELFDLGHSVATMKVKDIIGDRKLYTVEPDTSAAEIAHVMLTKQIAAVGVEQDGEIIGIVTRDSLVHHIYVHTLCEEGQELQ